MLCEHNLYGPTVWNKPSTTHPPTPKRAMSPPTCITHNTFDARFVLTLGHPQDMLTSQSEIVESLHTDSFQIAD